MRAKTLFCLSMAGVFITACSSSDSSHTEKSSLNADSLSAGKDSGRVSGDAFVNNRLEGFYVGDFEAVKENYDHDKVPMSVNRINISIDTIKGGKIYGHSVVAGNIRPFVGSYFIKNGIYEVEAKEPGNDQYDGVFIFSLDPETNDMIGKWVANNKKLAVPERSYVLSRSTFSYDPTLSIENVSADVFNVTGMEPESHEHITPDAGKINASTTRLVKEDVENMYKRDLEVMRNAIYARHGYSFKNREMRDFFDKHVSWYIPVSTDITKDLTELEKKNIVLIKRYEQHAETYYDSFGR
jgi:hypothetical protein